MIRIALILSLFFIGLTLGKADTSSCDDIKVTAEITHTSSNSLGEIEVKIENVSKPYEIYWIPPNSTIILSEPNQISQKDLIKGKYIMYLRDANGCRLKKEFVVK